MRFFKKRVEIKNNQDFDIKYYLPGTVVKIHLIENNESDKKEYTITTTFDLHDISKVILQIDGSDDIVIDNETFLYKWKELLDFLLSNRYQMSIYSDPIDPNAKGRHWEISFGGNRQIRYSEGSSASIVWDQYLGSWANKVAVLLKTFETDEINRQVLKRHSINDVGMIKFYIGGYSSGHEVTSITKNENGAIIELSHIPRPIPMGEVKKQQVSEEEWRKILSALNVDFYNWTSLYDEWEVMDGIQWEFTISFTDQEKVRYSGSNQFPCDFGDLKEWVDKVRSMVG